MKPDRFNYEIWLIDWLDGKLDQAQTELLLAFLEANPDIKEETAALSLSKLADTGTGFPGKEILKKSISDLPASQIEYLSVAYLEKDINETQAKELNENISSDAGNKKIFDTIQKTILKPDENIIFRNKAILIKETTSTRVIKFPVAWLSAAAAILLIITLFLAPEFRNDGITDTASSVETEDAIIKPFEVRTDVYYYPEEKVTSPEGTAAGIKPEPAAVKDNPLQTAELNYPEPLLSEKNTNEDKINAVPVFLPAGNFAQFTDFSLLASKIKTPVPGYYDEDRTRLGKFIARNFREKLLDEEIAGDDPLKAYEIAEAGIEGLNKLLGWEMALVRNNDEEGDVSSLYFSSKIIKFNAPVKKEEPSL
jgi:hypothetical protein